MVNIYFQTQEAVWYIFTLKQKAPISRVIKGPGFPGMMATKRKMDKLSSNVPKKLYKTSDRGKIIKIYETDYDELSEEETDLPYLVLQTQNNKSAIKRKNSPCPKLSPTDICTAGLSLLCPKG